jgi:beta-lactamase regulating signal transducer with metallopeptidase domain
MHILAEFANSFFTSLWRASWQASVVIVLVLLAQWLFRNQLSPRWRHALWLLVVLRLLLPVTIESPVSLFNVVGAKTVGAVTGPVPANPAEGGAMALGEAPVGELRSGDSEAGSSGGVSWRLGAPAFWLGGCALLSIWVLYTTWQLARKVRAERPVTNGVVLDVLEDCKQAMGVHTPLSLVETAAVKSPSLFGFIRPRLLLPAGLTSSFSPAELRYVFLHELGHVKRGDIPVNWLLTIPLVLHWFNPLVWLALSRMRVDGELACDALALSHATDTETKSYGQTVIKLLERFSRPTVLPGLVGILENNNQMKARIRMIAKFSRTNRWAALAAAVFGALALVTLTDAQTARPASDTSAVPEIKGPPRVVSTTPAVGDTEVDPGITEITVTFDQDMGGGFSWTGGGPDYPTIPEGQKIHWKDKRTCVMPVKLQSAHYYRVGINSTSYQNFKSASGMPARTSAIYFATKGASEEIKRKVSKPQIVGLIPMNGAKDVDPNLNELRVTFNIPMGGGFSWTGSGPEYPTIPEGKKPFWTEDHKTCVLPVQLEPGKNYRLGLNSVSHKNFQSAGGVPLDPVTYTFRTR